ncbi:putative membrane protein [Propionispora sp. 2/2-37]|uniref:hypothetical protein n=1 Tax=Propionispora sp. 2/2-37 TaxID=1677858 RepID=UPI0006BB73C5|nr:hypothetical protein [Propionispora sp. 2/2-37]CUH96642.1 putative membrane protein [Propionispora sp. 2/2-37]
MGNLTILSVCFYCYCLFIFLIIVPDYEKFLSAKVMDMLYAEIGNEVQQELEKEDDELSGEDVHNLQARRACKFFCLPNCFFIGLFKLEGLI